MTRPTPKELRLRSQYAHVIATRTVTEAAGELATISIRGAVRCFLYGAIGGALVAACLAVLAWRVTR